MNAEPATAALPKSLGAFYTDEPTADRLVSWAITDGSQAVLDASCGDGVLLSAACSRFRRLGNETPTICGIDVSKDALKLAHERVEGAKSVHSDFFKPTARFRALMVLSATHLLFATVVVCSNLNCQRRRGHGNMIMFAGSRISTEHAQTH